jgi:hypothetical protein
VVAVVFTGAEAMEAVAFTGVVTVADSTVVALMQAAVSMAGATVVATSAAEGIPTEATEAACMAVPVATEGSAEILHPHAAAGALLHTPEALGMRRPDGMGLEDLAAQQAWVARVARGLPMATGTPSALTTRPSPRSTTPISSRLALRRGAEVGVGAVDGAGVADGVGAAVGVRAAGAADGALDSALDGVPLGLPSGTGRRTGTAHGSPTTMHRLTTLIPSWRGVPEIRDISSACHLERSERPMYFACSIDARADPCEARRLRSRISGTPH